jgi:hypothetical protein
MLRLLGGIAFLPHLQQETLAFTCEFFDHCNPPIPEDHILRLPRIHASTVAKLVALGVQSIHDISENYPLTRRLRRALAEICASGAGAGDEIRGHGSVGRKGCRVGLGIALTGRLGSSRAGQGQEGAAGILWSRHIGEGQTAGKTQVGSQGESRKLGGRG